MSKTTISSPKKANKKAALGRGLGSLLGADPDDEFVETPIKPATSTNEVSLEFKAEKVKPLKEGFIESKTEQTKIEKKETSAPPQPKVPDTARIWQVPIEKLKGNIHQPRKDFDAQPLEDLANSIKAQGILQPIVARKIGSGEFEIIAGERRWRAAQQAGLQKIPVILKQTTEQKALELALIENIQREDLNPVEEAEAYQWLMKTYELTQQELAHKIGKERATIANSLRLLKLHPDLRTYLRAGELAQGQAKVLLSVDDQDVQKKIGFEVIKKKLTVRETERLVSASKTKGDLKTETVSSIDSLDISSSLIKGLSEEMQKLLGTRVAIDYNQGKGKIKINFYSDNELDGIVEKLRKSWQK